MLDIPQKGSTYIRVNNKISQDVPVRFGAGLYIVYSRGETTALAAGSVGLSAFLFKNDCRCMTRLSKRVCLSFIYTTRCDGSCCVMMSCISSSVGGAAKLAIILQSSPCQHMPVLVVHATMPI
jgi:hypothetical protein